MLATSGLVGLTVGCRRAEFAGEAAEYLPACALLQGAALMAWLGAYSPTAALLRCMLFCCVALLAYVVLRRSIVLPRQRRSKRSAASPNLQRIAAAKR